MILFPQSLQTPINELAELINKIGGRAFCVGGCVRDVLLGLVPKDIDVEVFGIEPDKLLKELQRNYAVSVHGKSFGVIHLKKLGIDVSIPRKEFKMGEGHKGFVIQSDPFLSYETAAARRDFTINAISWDPLTGEFIDPFNGVQDIQNRLLRHTSTQFSEDPLRVLRGIQFIARFELRAAPETIELCRHIGQEGLSKERIFEEWKKLILYGKRISLGLEFLRQTAWLQYFPELAAFVDCPQDPEWHPEGDVWAHILLCMDAFANERTGDEREDLIIGLGVLCHDLGKPSTTALDSTSGRIRALGHDVAGEPLTRSFLERLTDEKAVFEEVIPLVLYHMRPSELFKAQASDSAIRRLARNVRLDRLVRIMRADMQGCYPRPSKADEVGNWLLARAEALNVKDKAPQPIMKGRHLIELGYAPGPNFSEILNACYEAQLEGLFADEAAGITFLKDYLGR